LRHPVELRFYDALNDFLPLGNRQRSFAYQLTRETSMKDLIESQGVPHTEVELILVNGEPVGFDYRVAESDRIAVYPAFSGIDISGMPDLREPLAGGIRFVLDCHLGRLARYLRQFGFDTLYQNDFDDNELAQIAAQQNRVLLTRDRALLKHKIINHGYFVRATQPIAQFHEVMQRFDVYDQIEPFGRCTRCNGEVIAVNKADIIDQLEAKTRRYYNDFWQCRDCGQVYWEGSHFDHMQQTTDHVFAAAREHASNCR
jgi:uncharacterized protein with PIN domain/sulfur carrier protein ThiS